MSYLVKVISTKGEDVTEKEFSDYGLWSDWLQVLSADNDSAGQTGKDLYEITYQNANGEEIDYGQAAKLLGAPGT